MSRHGAVWSVFGLCLVLAAWAMTRVGATALAVERAEAKARRQASLEENLRLALWRMDSALAPLMAEESARPYFSYTPFYPAERAFTRMFAEIQRGDILMPSPLLTFESPQVRLHFQYGPDGRLASPQAPAGNMRDLAESRYLSPERVERASMRLDELGKLVGPAELASALAIEGPDSLAVVENGITFAPGMGQVRGDNEYTMRSRATKLAQNAAPAQALPFSSRQTVSQGPLRAVWFGPALVLARRVRVEEGTFLQGCWLDWDVIRRDLESSAADLVPGAALEPVASIGNASPARMLASLPARLAPAAITQGPEPWRSPVRLSLAIAWGCLALAAAAAALLLHGALALSERRGTFVSAVTHELRTPLTTFRLYTEMLDEGMVASPETRDSYVKTLRAEADRLGHLVENVLAFARLERGRAAGRAEVVSPTDLLDRLIPRLDLRARQAGMALAVESAEPPPDPAPPTLVRADPSVVEQILSNLVDNAIKYAGAAEDRRIHVLSSATGGALAVAVRDHGPGLAPRAVRRLFRPFSKSADDAASTAPGVGLGLALSRRLARAMGGDLRLLANGPRGACFVLTLPLAAATAP